LLPSFAQPVGRPEQSRDAVRIVPSASPSGAFLNNSDRLLTEFTLRLLAPEQMADADRKTVEDVRNTIDSRAALQAMPTALSGWSYKQIACPAFPGHLLLRFSRSAGSSDVSEFSVAIPRTGQGKVHVLPIRRRSFSLFTPVSVNAQTVALFNRIREEEGEPQQDWTGVGLCYAALAGANPWVLLPSPAEKPGVLPSPSLVELAVETDGSETIRFTDRAAQPVPMDWILVFNKQGSLLKATHKAATTLVVHDVPPLRKDLAGTPVPDTRQIDISTPVPTTLKTIQERSPRPVTGQ
jgi:hypothetical protein